MSTSNKIVLVVMSLVLFYFAVWLGDAGAVAYSHGSYGRWAGVFNFVTLVFGVIFTIISLAGAFDLDGAEVKDFEFYGACGFICGSYLLGAFAMPLERYGTGVWMWGDPWTFLPVFAFVPMAVVIKDIVLDIIEMRRRSKALGTVTRLRG